jgi:hypothetical protein
MAEAESRLDLSDPAGYKGQRRPGLSGGMPAPSAEAPGADGGTEPEEDRRSPERGSAEAR